MSKSLMSKHLRVFALFAVAHMLSYFFRTANAALAGDLASEMQLDASQLGLMSSLFFLSFAAAQIPLGIGLDWIGPRWVTPGLMFFGALGSVIGERIEPQMRGYGDRLTPAHNTNFYNCVCAA